MVNAPKRSLSMTTHGGARPNTKRRPDDGRIHNRNRSGKGGRKGWRVWAKLGENEFMFDTGRKNEAEAIKAFAEQIGYEVKIEKEAVDGTMVTFDGQMSKKTFDTINAKNLVSHSVGTTLYANTEADAQEVASLLEQNPNYSRA